MLEGDSARAAVRDVLRSILTEDELAEFSDAHINGLIRELYTTPAALQRASRDGLQQALPASLVDAILNRRDSQGTSSPAVLSSYWAAVTRLENPSDVAKKGTAFIMNNQKEDNSLFHNLQPHYARSDVPVQLAVPPFQTIISAAWPGGEGDRVEPVSEDLHFANDLCMSMSRAFDDETARLDEFCRMLGHRFGGYHLKRAPVAYAHADVRVSLGQGTDVLMMVEAKHEAGTSGDSALQGAVRYAKHLAGQASSADLCRKPALLLELVGPQLRISGLAYVGGRVVCEPLSPMLSLLAMHDRQPEQVAAVARCLSAVRCVLPELAAFRAPTPAAATGLGSGLTRSGPPPSAATAGDQGNMPLPHHLKLLLGNPPAAKVQQFVGRNTMLYQVQCTSPAQRSVVKYVRQRYGENVHRAWAEQGLAPKLLGVEKVVGPWLAVTMEHLDLDSGWVPLTGLMLNREKKLQLELKLAGIPMSGIDLYYMGLAGALTLEQVEALGRHVQGKLQAAHQVPVAAAADPLEHARQAAGGSSSNCGAQHGSLPVPAAADPLEHASQAAGSSSNCGAQHHGSLLRGVHGDMRPQNVLVQLPLPLLEDRSLSNGAAAAKTLDIGTLQIAFIDFDWAGVDGVVRYPPLLNPAIPWPSGAETGRPITQAHDLQLLASTLEGKAGNKEFPWAADPSMQLGAALSSRLPQVPQA